MKVEKGTGLKRNDSSANQLSMRFARRFAVGVGVVIAIALVLCARGPISAQMFPLMKIVPIKPDQAFVEGYKAYQQRDFPATIERMEFASTHFPQLADYALFYLGSARRQSGDLKGAASSFMKLASDYPESVFADRAQLEYAQTELKLGNPELASTAAIKLVGHTHDPVIDQSARLVVAQAMAASQQFRSAYDEAQALRAKYPAGIADTDARKLAYSLLAAHPEIANTTSLDYHITEVALLLREGQPQMALNQIDAALAMRPAIADRAELTWLRAQALGSKPQAEEIALLDYLKLAPDGADAPAALNALAHLRWHVNDTAGARLYFDRLLSDFPHARLAPLAMFEAGRTYEDDANFAKARMRYLSLLRRYPSSSEAAEARFRAPFMLYMMKDYRAAAAEFEKGASNPTDESERDKFSYWQARALEKEGQTGEGRAILERLAMRVDTNYYPELAGMRVGVAPNVFPAAEVSVPTDTSLPNTVDPGFHLNRVLLLKQLGLRKLEPPELIALKPRIGNDPALRDFVLAEFVASDAWYDAIVTASQLAGRGELNPLVAEKLRYPRAYWNLIVSAAGGRDLNPYLVLALMRQESLFNPDATSVSDARGLMQLMGPTANRYAAAAGITSSPLDLFDPNLSVQIGTTYLQQLFSNFSGDMFKAVAAYNAGQDAVDRWVAKYPGDDDQWVENIGYAETREYVKRVIGGLREYRLLYKLPRGNSASTAQP